MRVSSWPGKEAAGRAITPITWTDVSVHFDPLADGIDVLEPGFADILADHDHGHAMLALHVGEEAARYA